MLSFAASSPGEFRLKARLKLADPLLTAGEVHVETPKSFGDACDRGKLAWERVAGRRLERPNRTKQLQAEARECFRFALAHPPRDVKTDDLNAIRYCLAYLDWAAEDYYDAAVLGEFLARRYPDRPEAQRGAEIALKAYARLCAEASAGDDRKFEAARMTAIADFITSRWPKSPVADEAWMMLIRAAMAKRDSAKALECLGRIAADSPRRGDAELMTGQALWNAYLEAARLPEEQQPTKAEMTKMISDGAKAVGGRRRPAAKAASTPAEKSRIRWRPDRWRWRKSACKWARERRPSSGSTIRRSAPTRSPRRTTRRSTAATSASRPSRRRCGRTWPRNNWTRPKQTMNALEKAGGAVNVARIYISLGRQLEESLKRLRAEGNQAEAAKVARGFEFFLTRIAARPAAESTFATLYWVAETFMNLGDSLAPDDGKPPPEAMKYYEKAAEVYEKIIEACQADPKFAPQPGSSTAVQIRLARCLRRLGKFEEALDALVEILKTRENLLEAQREAAYTYQAWGEEKPGYFMLAIRGGHKVERKDGSVSLSGLGLGRNRPQGPIRRKLINDIFNEARYNLALCRLKYAQSKTGQEQHRSVAAGRSKISSLFRESGPKWAERSGTANTTRCCGRSRGFSA